MSKPAPGAGSLKDLEKKSREVLKPILDNPFTSGLQWPVVTPEVAERIMQYLVEMLSSYGNYLEMKNSKGHKPPEPPLASKITIGFNSTVKKLEQQAAPNRARILGQEPEVVDGSFTKYVFVAKNDITSPLLASPFPLLTYSASRSDNERVILVELPKGSASRLSKTLKTKNVSIISLTDDWTDAASLYEYINANVSPVDVPWLDGLFDGRINERSTFEKPQVQFLKTSMPIGKGKRGKSSIKGKKEDGRVSKK